MLDGALDDTQLFILPLRVMRHGLFNCLNDGALQLSIDISEANATEFLDDDIQCLGAV